MLKVFLYAVAATALCGCSSPSTAQWYHGKTPEERVEIIRGLPVDQQLDHYLVAMRNIHPPPFGLTAEIAQGGRATAHRVAQRIRASHSFEDKTGLLWILDSMREMGIYDSCRDPAVRAAILPEGYGVDEPLSRQLYALGIIDLCVREAGRPVMAEPVRPPK